MGGTRSTITMSLSGARATWANYTLDGITNTDVDFNLYILLPSVDAIQEFKVQTGIYPAEFGRELSQLLDLVVRLEQVDLDTGHHLRDRLVRDGREQLLAEAEEVQVGGVAEVPASRPGNRVVPVDQADQVADATDSVVRGEVGVADHLDRVDGRASPAVVWQVEQPCFSYSILPRSTPVRLSA